MCAAGVLGAAVGVETMLVASIAFGADAAWRTPTSIIANYDWSGAYVGGHAGYGRGQAHDTVSANDPPVATNSFGSAFGGLQLGYNHVLPSRFLQGIEADVSFFNFLGSDDVVSSRAAAQTTVTEKIDYIGTVRGRVGYLFDHWLVYATGGLAWSQGRFLQSSGIAGDENKALQIRPAWAAGIGAEVPAGPEWTAKIEYLYTRFGEAEVPLPSGSRSQSAFDLQSLRVGLNRKLNWPEPAATATPVDQLSAPDFGDWNIHGQTTYIGQGYFRFTSPYEGQNSLSGANQARNTVSATAFLGLRLWDGGEVYYAPELAEGFGLSDTFGLAGFSNGEAQKAGFPYPHYDTSRIFLQQTFGLGGEQETIEDEALHIGGKEDISRITLTAGRVYLSDLINRNTYSDDARTKFLNWSLWWAGAYDAPADQLGYSWAAFAELNQKDWAVRGGYLLMPKESNSNDFDMQLFGRGEYLIETENRYSLLSHPGTLRLLGFVNLAYAGSYAETLADPNLNMDITQTRQSRIKYGYVVNFEQSILDDFGVFGRWSWNNGKTEIMAYSDIDASASLGAVLKGTSWCRPDDRIGVAGAVNALSADHRAFLAAGGLGIVIGDGALNYRDEKLLEAYYSLALDQHISLTFDYQYIGDPAYNADRGPVSIFTGRLHADF